jgi:NADPH:quinone reductase-like Zn-dependent oxidoreductase
MLLSPFVGQRLRPLIASENATDLVALSELVESGAVTPAIDRVFPLAETAAAVRYLRAGQARGKVVVEV